MAHNLVYYDTSTNSVQKFSNTQIDDLAERVLRVMAAGTYTGTITIGTSNPIGTFTDTYYNQAAGTNQDSGISTGSTVYTLSQVTTATLGASADPPKYVGLDTTDPSTVILQENLTTLEQLADEILSRMVAGTGGTNSYYLGTSAPADGATWVSLGSLLDTRTAGTITVTDYKLWERTSSGATITSRNPMKITSDPLQSFTDTELNAIIKTIEQRIIATGVGTYSLQTTVPATGTWTNAGTITDTIENLSSSSYFGPLSFANVYTLSYLGQDDFFAWAGPGGVYTPISYDSTDYIIAYAGSTSYDNPVPFDGTTSFEGPSFATIYNHGYFQPYSQTYTTGYDSLSPSNLGYLGAPNNALSYVGPGSTTYLGPTPYGADFSTNYVASYGKYYTADYTGAPLYTVSYLQSYTASYTGTYSGPTYTVTYLNSFATYYTGGPDAAAYDLAQFTPGVYTSEDALTYTKVLIDSTTSSTGTKTLWRRIA